MKKRLFIILILFTCLHLQAQDTVRFIGKEKVNVDYHHGQLKPAVGVHNVQVFRANRQDTTYNGGINWTYNHAPMLGYWNGKFWLQYLSNPIGEHIPPGRTLLMSSVDGYTWSNAQVVFPVYHIPDGTTKEGRAEVAKNLDAVMHQRMGFFISSDNRLLTLAFYGIVLGKGDDPNDGHGIGRVVREIYKDGSFGPIYFIRVNSGWDSSNSTFPMYTKSKDKGFVKACNELLSQPLMMQQWVEEADRNDSLIPLKKDYKAFSFYHLKNGDVVGLWKNALTSISKDGGRNWQYNPLRAPGFVNSNAKIWGQKTSDGNYVTVYNPSEFRWPLALSLSKDGLNYDKLLLVNGDITSMRYGGAYKSYGPQYVRGMDERCGIAPDGNVWITYSMNKEDIWVGSISVPIQDKITSQVNDSFNVMPAGKELTEWNYNSGVLTRVRVENHQGVKALVLHDSDPFDYARAEHLIPASVKTSVSFQLIPMQNTFGQLDIEFADAKGNAAIRLTLDSTGNLITKAGYRNRNLIKYENGTPLNIRVDADASNRFYTVYVNGKKFAPGLSFAPIDQFERVIFRTGGVRRFPDADTPTDQDFDLPHAGSTVKESVYIITSFRTSNQ